MNLANLSRMIENLVRVGTVLEVDLNSPRCRVKSGKLETDWLRMPSERAGATLKWDPLTVGEQVIILSPSGNPAAGFVLPMGIFSDAITPPSLSADVHMTKYPDGAIVSYNHATHALSISGIKDLGVTATGNVNVTADGKATVTAPDIDLTDGNGSKGCVQGDSICAYTGVPHPHVSASVKASA